MNWSNARTESRFATETFHLFICRHSIPARSQASVKMRRMSSERFVNW
jgi:hypothetical protein